jgi:hypothetical protein
VGHSEKRRKRKMQLKCKENSSEEIKTLETSPTKRYKKKILARKIFPSSMKKNFNETHLHF